MRKNTIKLLILKFLKIGATVYNLSLLAKYFGVSIERDIWLLAFNAIMVFDLAIWGPINETFRTKFIFLKQEYGEAEALNKTKSLLFFIFFISSVLVLFIFLYPNIPAKLIAPSYAGEKLGLLLKMLVLIAPSFLINQAIQIGISILNAYESYFIPEISGFLSTIISIVLLLLLAPHIGIYALFISHYLSILVLMMLVVLQINKRKIRIFSSGGNFKFKDFLVFFLFALPFFLPYFVGQISSVLDKTIASSLGNGMISIIDYSKKFYEILIGVLTSVLTTILVPILSLKFAEKKYDDFVDEFLKIYQLGFLIVIVVISMFNACPQAFVKILYRSKLMSLENIDLISSMAMTYSWTSLGVFFYLIFGLVLLSGNKGKVYAFSGLTAQIMNIVFYFTLLKYLNVYVFPIALFISHLLAGFFMLYKFPVKSEKIMFITVKYFSILFLNVSLLYILNNNLFISMDPFLLILVNVSVLLIFLILQSFAFKLEERFLIVNFIKSLKND